MKRQFIALAAIFAIGVSLTSLYRGCHPRGIKIKPDNRYPEGLGEVLAEESARLVKGRGRILLLVREDPSGDAAKTALSNPVLTGLQRAMKQFPDLQLAGIEPVALVTDPRLHDAPSLISAADFFQILQRHPDVDVVVSFGGMPALHNEDVERLPARRPMWIVLGSGYRERLEGLIRSGIVNMAVVPRARSVPATAPAPNAARDYFNRLYTILTAANLDQPPQ